MRLLLRGILFAGMIFVVSCGRFAAWINAANHLPKLQGVTGKPQGRINRDCCSFRVRACEFVAPGEVGEMKTGAGRTLPEGMMFGPYKIDASQIFFVSESGLTAAFVNLRPIVPGHILVVPIRNTVKMHQLNAKEVADLWTSAVKIGERLEGYYGADALNYAVQDSPAAGQSVPHVHVHILPRKRGDFPNNNDVYAESPTISKICKPLLAPQIEGHQVFPSDEDRVIRSKEEMAREANEMRMLFF